ncbi:mediator of DNA damage checkpoint protein 1-like isoform X2 [Amphibalanus amphitrite]|uniref:mediator of DNA damage checkpoint protein 1-like isoform X2 n=1 Tax=Amphibalanus amphitrite TaxID=1232801 RepID=UPI001C904668|nr:mediator of DNA damage checkpoint protein 1-like isoform X2 [Amphibalanus amphitrite]
MESQSLLDDSLVTDSQPGTTDAGIPMCPAYQIAPGPAQAPPTRLVAASDDSDTDYEGETEQQPLPLRSDSNASVSTDKCSSRAIVNATFDDDSDTDMSDAEDWAIRPTRPSPTVSGIVAETPSKPEPDRSFTRDTVEREAQLTASTARSTSVDLEADTQLCGSAATASSVDLEAETQLNVTAARSISVDLEAETQLDGGVAHSTSVDLEAETQLGAGVAHSTSVDLEAETQLSVSAARSTSVDLEAETQLGAGIVNSTSVDLEAEAQLVVSASRSAAVDLEAETQLGRPNVDARDVPREMEVEDARHVDRTEKWPPEREATSDDELDAPTQVYPGRSKQLSDGPGASRRHVDSRDSENCGFRKPKIPGLGSTVVAGARMSSAENSLNVSDVDLDAPTQVFDTADDEDQADDSLDLEAATQVFRVPSEGYMKVPVSNSKEDAHKRKNHSVESPNVSGVDLDAATQVFRIPSEEHMDVSDIDLDAETQAFSARNKTVLDKSSVDLDAPTQAYHGQVDTSPDRSDIDLGAATQIYRAPGEESMNVSAVDLEGATQVFRPTSKRSLDSSDVDLNAATQLFVGSGGKGQAQDVADTESDEDEDSQAGGARGKAILDRSCVDLDAPTQAFHGHGDASPTGSDDIDLGAATQIYKARGEESMDVSAVDLDGATQVFEPASKRSKNASRVDLDAATQLFVHPSEENLNVTKADEDTDVDAGEHLNDTHIDLDAATQVFKMPRKERSVNENDNTKATTQNRVNNENLSNEPDIDEDASTQIFNPKSAATPGTDEKPRQEEIASTSSELASTHAGGRRNTVDVDIEAAVDVSECGDAASGAEAHRPTEDEASRGVAVTDDSDTDMSDVSTAQTDCRVSSERVTPGAVTAKPAAETSEGLASGEGAGAGADSDSDSDLEPSQRVSSPVLSPRQQPESPSGVVDDPEDMIATQRMPSPGRRTGGGEKLPLTPQRAGGEKLPLTPQRAGGEKLPLTPQRTCSGLSTESETDDYRIELPSTQELLQVLAMSSSQSAPSPPVQEMQEEDSESPVRSPSLLEESPPPLVPSDTSTVRSVTEADAARRLFADSPSQPEESRRDSLEREVKEEDDLLADTNTVEQQGPEERRRVSPEREVQEEDDLLPDTDTVEHQGRDGEQTVGPAGASTSAAASTEVAEDDADGDQTTDIVIDIVEDSQSPSKAARAGTSTGVRPTVVDLSSPEKQLHVISSPVKRQLAGRQVRAAAGRGRGKRRATEGAVSAGTSGAGQTVEAMVGRRTSSRRVKPPEKFSPSKPDSGGKRRRSDTPNLADSSSKRRRAAAAPVSRGGRRRTDPLRQDEGAATVGQEEPGGATDGGEVCPSGASLGSAPTGEQSAAAPVSRRSGRQTAGSRARGRGRRVAGTPDRVTEPGSPAHSTEPGSPARRTTRRAAGSSSRSTERPAADSPARSTGRGSPVRRTGLRTAGSPARTTAEPGPPVRRTAWRTAGSPARSTGHGSPARSTGRRTTGSPARSTVCCAPARRTGRRAADPPAADRQQRPSAARPIIPVVIDSDSASEIDLTASSPETVSSAAQSRGNRRTRVSHRQAPAAAAKRPRTARSAAAAAESSADVAHNRPKKTARDSRAAPSHLDSPLDETRSIAPSTITVSSQTSVRSASSSGRGVTPSNHPRVLFTGFERDSADEQIVKSLGGTVVERPAECTVLVTTGVKRTIKLMACFARGTPIVTPAWLTKSKQAKCFLDPWQFLVEDKAAEAKFGFCFGLNLRKASRRAHPLLEGWSVYVTPQVRPPPDQLKEVIECAGGLFLPRLPRSSADRVAVISCGEDARHWPAARRLHLPVVSAELLLTGVLHQRIDVRRHALTG